MERSYGKQRFWMPTLALGFLLASSPAMADHHEKKHVAVHRAEKELERAKEWLGKAPPRYGAQLQEASTHIEEALKALRDAIRYADEHPA